MISNDHLELFRDALLRCLKAARPAGLNVFTLEIALRSCGFRHFDLAQLEAELQYFVDKGFVVDVQKSHSRAYRIWRIATAGIDDLELKGL